MHHLKKLMIVSALISVMVVVAACGDDKNSEDSASSDNVVSTVSSNGASGGVAVGTPAFASSGSVSTAPAFQVSGGNQQTGIWVSGTGQVLVQPDIAVITVGVEAKAKTVATARDQAAISMNAMIDALKAAGIQDKDIQTQFFNISPEYSFQDRTDAFGDRVREQVLVGYRVTNRATVKVRDIDQTGKVLDDVARAGGDLTQIQGINFTVSDPSPFHVQAREVAVKEALAKARQFADLTGVSLGKVVFISEVSSTPIFRQAEPSFEIAAAVAAPTPISGGELEIRVTVQAAFAIQ